MIEGEQNVGENLKNLKSGRKIRKIVLLQKLETSKRTREKR